MGTTIPCAPPPPGGKDTPVFIRVGTATAEGRSAAARLRAPRAL